MLHGQYCTCTMDPQCNISVRSTLCAHQHISMCRTPLYPLHACSLGELMNCKAVLHRYIEARLVSSSSTRQSWSRDIVQQSVVEKACGSACVCVQHRLCNCCVVLCGQGIQNTETPWSREGEEITASKEQADGWIQKHYAHIAGANTHHWRHVRTGRALSRRFRGDPTESTRTTAVLPSPSALSPTS